MPASNPDEFIDLQLPASNRRGSHSRWLLHAYRVGVLVLILWMIRQQHASHQTQQSAEKTAAVPMAEVGRFFPSAARLTDGDPSHGSQTVVDAAGEPLGYVVRTAPKSDFIIGYSGPNDVLLAFDLDDRIVGLAVLTSGDTPEHLAAVVGDERFLHSFNGLTWEQAGRRNRVDGVSGATLTSLAIAEGIVYRLGGVRPSYRFPAAISVEETKRFFPEAASLESQSDSQHGGRFHVLDVDGRRIGSVARTAPTGDDLIGYQGPTDTLIAFDAQGRVKGIAVRSSYETPEYLAYVADDDYFLTLFNGMEIEKLSALDLQEAEVEGVSGATMTSQAIARSLVKTAAELVRKPPADESATRQFAVRSRDVGTALVAVFAVLVAFTRLRGVKPVRFGFQLVLIVYLGFINGDLLSQAILVGWSQSGLPWRLAPGVVLLTAAALLVPLTTRRQLYCHYVCPHGAAQELLKNRLPWKIAVSRRWLVFLKLLPGLLLAWVLLAALWPVAFNLVGIEPFDAYMVRVAGWATISVAAVGLVASLFVPMAYCRFGCPTGAVLNFLRLAGRNDRFSRRDWFALVLLALAAALFFGR